MAALHEGRVYLKMDECEAVHLNIGRGRGGAKIKPG